MAKTRAISATSAPTVATVAVQDVPSKDASGGGRLFVDIDTSVEDVIRLDAEGVDLFFESDKGKFLELDETTLKGLSKMTRTRYEVSKALNMKHDPAMDGFSARLSVGASRNRQSEVRKILRETPMTADAMRMLTAYAGHGFKEHWARPDKMAHWMAKGYEVVKAKGDGPEDPNVFTEAKVIDGHFETQGTTPNKTELVLMRAPMDVAMRNQKAADEANARQTKAADADARRSGLSEGIAGRADLAWHDA
jgi:hypothetical protein